MQSSDAGAVALRLSTLLVLGAITLGLLVWYGTVTTTAALAVGTLAVGGHLSLAVAAQLPTADGLVVLAQSREPWEVHYMYGVSALAACWVVTRGVSQWRFDPRTLTVVPRERGEGSTVGARCTADERVDTSEPVQAPDWTPIPRGDATIAERSRPIADGGGRASAAAGRRQQRNDAALAAEGSAGTAASPCDDRASTDRLAPDGGARDA